MKYIIILMMAAFLGVTTTRGENLDSLGVRELTEKATVLTAISFVKSEAIARLKRFGGLKNKENVDKHELASKNVDDMLAMMKKNMGVAATIPISKYRRTLTSQVSEILSAWVMELSVDGQAYKSESEEFKRLLSLDEEKIIAGDYK